MTADLDELRRGADLAGVTGGRVLHRTGKSIVAAGTRDGTPVIVKMITTGDAYWLAGRERELAAYRRFVRHPPRFPVPVLLWADDRTMVLSALPGVRLHEQRHLDRDLDAPAAGAVIAALRRVAATPSPPEPADDTRGRVEREVLLDAPARRALHGLLDRIGPATAFAHGDPIPTNVLLHDGGAVLVDWELCGRFLPGYDLAVLHVVGAAATPTLAAAIDAEVRARGLAAPFTVNVGLLLCREIRMHRALPPGPVAERLGARLAAWRAGALS